MEDEKKEPSTIASIVTEKQGETPTEIHGKPEYNPGMFEKFMDERIAKARAESDRIGEERSARRRSRLHDGSATKADRNAEIYRELTGKEIPHADVYDSNEWRRNNNGIFDPGGTAHSTLPLLNEFAKLYNDNRDAIIKLQNSNYGAFGERFPELSRGNANLGELKNALEVINSGGFEAYEENERRKGNTSEILNLEGK